MRTRSRVADFQKEKNAELTTMVKEKAEVVSKFFSDVFTREDMRNDRWGVRTNTESLLYRKNFSLENIKKKLKHFKTGKFSGPDGIPSPNFKGIYWRSIIEMTIVSYIQEVIGHWNVN